LRTLRVLVNRQIGSSVYPSAYAAYMLLGGQDAYCSFITAVFATYQFVEAVKTGVGGARGSDVTYTPVSNAGSGKAWTSQYDD